jgi:hypothetical protein
MALHDMALFDQRADCHERIAVARFENLGESVSVGRGASSL